MARRTLPVIDLINTAGLYTKTNPDLLGVNQLRIAENVDFFNVYGATSKLSGSKRVLASKYQENGITKPITWVGFYKYVDLAGKIVRHTLIAAGSKFHRVESNGSLTELKSGYPENVLHISDMFDRWLLISSQDPSSPGNRGTPLKYDGSKLLDWGVVAPGSRESFIDKFDSTSNWNVTNGTITVENSIVWSDSSIKLSKTDTTQNICWMEKVYTQVFSINSIVEDRAYLYVYIPPEEFSKLSKVGRAISVYFTSDANISTNYVRYDFQIGRLFEGWNKLIFDFSTLPTGDFGTSQGVIQPSLLKYVRIELITNNILDTPSVYVDHLVSLDQGAPSVSNGNQGDTFISGKKYSYRITFIREDGSESNAGPESPELVIQNATPTTSGSETIELTQLPTSTDPSVIGRNIYRTVADGNDWLYLDTIYDNQTTTYSDKIPDTGLGTQSVPLEGSIEIDRSPPPRGSFFKVWKRTVFMAGDPLNPNLLYFSRDDDPDSFPLLNAFEFDEPITGIFETFSSLIVTTQTSYWRVFGNNPDYIVEKIIDGFGAVGPRAVGSARVVGWAADRDGVRLYDLNDTVKITEVIRDKYEALDKTSLEDMFSVHLRRHNSILFFMPDNTIFLYQYAIDDLRNGWFSEIKLPSGLSIKFTHAVEVEDSNGDFHLYVSADDGMLYELMTPNATSWEDANGTKYSSKMKFQTIFIRAGAIPLPVTEVTDAPLQVTGRVTPRFVEVRAVEPSNKEFTLTISLESASGSADSSKIRGSKTLNMTFPPNMSLQRMPIDLTPDEYIRIRVEHEDDKTLPIIYGIRVYFIPRPGQYPVIGTADNIS